MTERLQSGSNIMANARSELCTARTSERIKHSPPSSTFNTQNRGTLNSLKLFYIFVILTSARWQGEGSFKASSTQTTFSSLDK